LTPEEGQPPARVIANCSSDLIKTSISEVETLTHHVCELRQRKVADFASAMDRSGDGLSILRGESNEQHEPDLGSRGAHRHSGFQTGARNLPGRTAFARCQPCVRQHDVGLERLPEIKLMPHWAAAKHVRRTARAVG
jgi:hypothetical protein